jgi:hypothetical protein
MLQGRTVVFSSKLRGQRSQKSNHAHEGHTKLNHNRNTFLPLPTFFFTARKWPQLKMAIQEVILFRNKQKQPRRFCKVPETEIKLIKRSDYRKQKLIIQAYKMQ